MTPKIQPGEQVLFRIPTYDAITDHWTHTDFYSREELKGFVLSLFKEPGKYNFDYTSTFFNRESRRFNKDKYYCEFLFGSRDYRNYWDTEKEKCKKGVIYNSPNGTQWYIPRDYYMWLNFLPIFNKEQNDFTFPEVRDAQYHMALYEYLAELNYKHAVILKKRQIAASYYHMAKLINLFYFEKGVTLKLLASQDSFINEDGSWVFLTEYRDFLNKHTAWYRPCDPDKVQTWQQKIKVTIGNREVSKGNKSRLLGISTQQSPTRGVGGPSRLIVYEEGGIAPTADKTYIYASPALSSGFITTGLFVMYGSVGDLHQCEPLKKFLMHPKENDFYAVKTDLVDNKGTIAECGLFIPEQWSMPPFIDQYGNSQVEEALKALKIYREEIKRDLEAADYQLKVSQRPITIEEAFAWREESIFPQHLVSKQIQRIEDGLYPEEYVELSRDDQGKIIDKPSKVLPITEFPLSKKSLDKEGCLVVYERPDPKAEWGTYFGSVDPVAEGKTTTSDSLVSIIIYKNNVQVIKRGELSAKQHIEGGKIVASWCGRFDDINDTHKRLELIIEWYKAWTLVENNISQFIQYMISINKQHWLVPKDQILFLKELSSNNGYTDYGWKNVGTLFKSHLLSYGIKFLTEKIYEEHKPDGEVVKITYGVERIPDKMILKEMAAYRPGLNVDRLVAFCALVAFVAVQEANRGYVKRIVEEKNLKIPPKKVILKCNPFKHMGGHSGLSQSRPPRNPFKSLK